MDETKKHKPLTVTIDDGCNIMGIKKTKTYELIGNGELETISIGRRRLIVYSSIEAFLERLRKTSLESGGGYAK